MNNKKDNILNLVLLSIGELIVSMLVVGVFLIGDLLFDAEFWDFSYRIITGAALGAVVTILNYLFLTITVDRAINNYLALRGTREMAEEEAVDFAAKNAMGIQNAIKTSFLVRTASIVVTLAVAFLLDAFAPIATIVPLLCYRPLLYLVELIKNKLFGKPDISIPEAVTYEAHEVDSVATDITDNNEEKESDA